MKRQHSILSLAVFAGMLMLAFNSCNTSVPVGPASPEGSAKAANPHYHGKGCLLLPADEYNRLPRAVAPVRLSKAAAAAVVTLDCPPVGDQMRQGSCTAWGTAYAARSISWHYKTGGTWSQSVNIFSPEYVYNQTYDQTYAGGCEDAGAYTTDPLKLMQSKGVCRWSVWPYKDSTCTVQPNDTQTSDAANYKTAGYSTVSITTAAIKSFLTSNKSVIVAGPVDMAFELLKSGAVLNANPGSSLGGHCYCVVGYNDSLQAFKFMNSWSTSWATAGFGYIGYSVITKWWQEAYVINDSGAVVLPGQATAPTPADGLTGVSATPTLSWTAGFGETSHDVYFGTTNPPPLAGNQTAATYTPSGLSALTTYYWRVDEKNSAGTTTGTVWSFTTAAAPTSVELTNNIPVTGLGANTGVSTQFFIKVPANARNLSVTTSGGTGDADLYVKFNAVPTTSVYDYRSWANGNTEAVSVAAPGTGTYYVMLYAYKTFSGLTLVAKFDTGAAPAGKTWQETNLSAARGKWNNRTVVIPAGMSAFKITLSGGTGNADLYIKFGAQPTTGSYDVRSRNSGNSETATITSPKAGTYYVGLYGTSAFSGVTLNGQYK